LPSHTELHACDIFVGKGAFRRKPRSARIRLIAEVLELVPTHGLRIIWAAIHKQSFHRMYHKPAFPADLMHPHDLAFMLVAERCQRFLTESSPDECGLFIADESPGCERMLRSSLREYQTHGAHIGPTAPMDRLLDTVHFVDSAESPFIQIADFCAYFARRDRTASDLEIGEADPRYRIIEPRVLGSRVFP